MNPRLKDVLDMISLEELNKLKTDLEKYKGIHLKKLVNEKIMLKQAKTGVCSVCLSDILPYSTDNYTLNFGPKDFKKKVNICSNECMHLFLNNMARSSKLNENPRLR